MEVSHPVRGVIPTLDAPVLEVLAGTTKPLSGREVHRLARTGSDRGVRLVLNRLVAQGLATADQHAGATLYVANRAHLAWPAIEALVGLRATLLDRLRELLAGWPIAPGHASVFGSAARGDGDEESDIDILIVRPEASPNDAWETQLEALRSWVLESTGNRCQIFDVDRSRFAVHVMAADPLVAAWRREGIHLVGVSIETLVRSSRRSPA
jgi:hypothetical protein